MLIRDALRGATRFIRRQPALALLVVLILGIGIGAATAATNVAASILFNPLPVKQDSRVVLINKVLPGNSALAPFSYSDIQFWREATLTVGDVAGVQYDGAWPVPMQLETRAATITGTMVSGNFFEVLGLQPVLGRLLTDADAAAGAERVGVISHGVWITQFGQDSGIVGRRIRIDGRPTTVVGVVPAGFDFPKGAELWQPLDRAPSELDEGWFTLVGRLRADAEPSQAREESTRLLNRLRERGARNMPDNVQARVVPLREAIVGDVRPVMALFVAAAGILFVVGCINVMNLLLVRGAARERELAVRRALGATRRQLLTQLVTEVALLAIVAGAVGALLAFWLQRALIAASPPGIPRLDQVGFTGAVVAGAFGASLLAAAIAGALPALWTLPRTRFHRIQSVNVVSGAPPRQRASQLLVALQFTFALLVVIAAGLLLRSLRELQTLSLGFSPENLTVVQVPLVGSRYDDADRRRQLFEQLVSRLESMPELSAATAVLLRPFTGTAGWDATYAAEGQTPNETAANPAVQLESVLPNYFATVQAPIRAGRAFTGSDGKGGLPVAIVSESIARSAWPGQSAIGRRLKFGGADSPAPWMTVVGVVGDLRYRDVVSPPPAIYVPASQNGFPLRFLLVRVRANGAPIAALTQRALSELDSNEPVPGVAAVDGLLSFELAGPRFRMEALVLFAGITGFLAGVGIFGVLGSFVEQRSRELGLRVALGATANDIRSIVLTKAGWPAAVGITVGTGIALLVTPSLAPLLFQVSAVDVPTFAAAWAVLVLAAAAAAFMPLRKAARCDPVALLRSE